MKIKHSFTVDSREGTGKGPNRRLRSGGHIPGVVYGPKREPVNVSLDLDEFIHFYDELAASAPLLNLVVKGEKEETVAVAIREVQVHPVKDTPTHVDFYQFDPEQPLTVSVPVKLVGRAKGVEIGGMLQWVATTLKLSAKPEDLPTRVKVDVTEMGVGQAMLVRDVRAQKDYNYQDEDAKVVARVIALRKAKTATEEEEEAEAAAAE